MTHLAVDELDVARALGITVSSAVLCTGLVPFVLGHSAIGIHGREVQSAVQPTGEVRDVHVKGEFLAQQVKHLIRAVVLHQVQAGTDVGAGDELQCQRVSISGYAVGCLVVCPVQGAVLGTCLVIGAESSVPLGICQFNP